MPSTRKDHLPHVRRAAALLNEIKTTAGCVDCGFNAWPESLHFDHLDPSTKLHSLGWVRDRSKLTSRSRLNRYLEHISLYCVVRCANCHAHRTIESGHHLMTARGVLPPAEEPTLF